jgi:hypothetical protein
MDGLVPRSVFDDMPNLSSVANGAISRWYQGNGWVLSRIIDPNPDLLPFGCWGSSNAAFTILSGPDELVS